MKRTVEIEGRTVVVEITKDGVQVDGKAVDAKLGGEPGTAIRTLIRGRTTTPLHAQPTDVPGSWLLSVDGFRLSAQVLGPRDIALRASGGKKAAAGGGTLKAPMPGLVVRVLVEEGASVVAGQPLVVVEAMKMENQLKATGPGVVTKIHVTPGARVEKGAPLLLVS